ncbi:OmpA family protein [Maribacter sp. 2304DJ31-5]|uniref:OmpA family protein n=1 Tax=Maribacter sp. 2304DJ31-5 TaxID=3386273 RepID=UPI0039BD80CD
MSGQKSLRVFVLMAVLAGRSVSFAQNLIKNPSFEEYMDCPSTLGNLNTDLIHWKTPTLGSTDYFNGCSTAMGTPKNFNGEQPADFGVGYVGLYFYAPDNYREYLQANLTAALKKGETYKLSFYVSLAERSDFAIKEFGVLFSEYPIAVRTRKTLSRMHLSQVSGDVSNYFEIKYSDFYSDEKDWILVEREFVAKGTENHMIIGNFKDNKRTRKFRTKKHTTRGSYYYLDMVSVMPLSSKSKNTDVAGITDNKKSTFKINKVSVFKNMLFDFDKFDLMPNSLNELEDIYDYLLENQQVLITINGHTDAVGGESYNKKLSEKRARTVGRYLINLGISKHRISWKGYGSSRPLVDNRTNDDRRKNRRVEFILTQE